MKKSHMRMKGFWILVIGILGILVSHANLAASSSGANASNKISIHPATASMIPVAKSLSPHNAGPAVIGGVAKKSVSVNGTSMSHPRP